MFSNLSRLYLENFQCIRGPVSIHFAPITLLYGPNSAGKSALFDAIRIAAMLCRGRWQDTPELSERLLASAHMHDFSAPVILGVGAELEFARWYDPDDIAPPFYLRDLAPALDRWLDDYKSTAPPCNWDVTFRIRFSVARESGTRDQRSSRHPYCDEIEVTEKGQRLVRIQTNAEPAIELNLAHPLIHSLNSSLLRDGTSLEALCEQVMSRDAFSIRNSALTISHQIDTEHYFTTPDHIWPSYDNPYAPNEISTKARQLLEIILKLLLVSPLRDIGWVAQNVTRIGPVRIIPTLEDLQYFMTRSSSHPSIIAHPVTGAPASWKNGSAAWCSLAENKDVDVALTSDALTPLKRPLLDAVNEWLNAPQRLGLNCLVHVTSMKVTPDSDVPNDDAPRPWGRTAEVERAASITVIRLRDTKRGVLVPVDEVGSGIAQLVPILVAGFEARQVFVEQPELHIHPKLHMEVADFFLSRWNSASHRSIIETHSEHFALRLLRRVRETTRAHILHREFSLRNEDIAFYYFDPKDGVTTITRLDVSPQGEFLTRWPKGFFAERETELFDEDDQTIRD